MDGWILLWKVLLVFTIAGFGLLVLVVGFGAIGDLKAMFADLRADLAAAERGDGSKAAVEAGEGEAVQSD